MTGGAARLSRPDLAPLVEELARRFAGGDAPSTISLQRMPASACRSLADLLGVDRVPRAHSRIRVDRLVDRLGLASLDELRAAVEALRGPIPDRRAEREARRVDGDALWSWLEREARELPLATDPARMAGWVEAQRLRGARGGVEAHRATLRRALRVLRSLPADGVPLAVFAADHAGDPHALDHRRALAGMVLDAIASALDVPPPGGAEEARLLWEAVGVAPDLFSSTVLVLGLAGGTGTPLERWLGETAAACQPAVLSLANLRQWPLEPLSARFRVFVVENPSILAEASAREWRGPVLVCSSGRPSVAVVTLLRQLGAGGARLHQHADFDPAGLAITAWLADHAGTSPWQMTSGDYLDAVLRGGERPTIKGHIPPTPWDPSLQEALEREGVAVYEEDIRAALLGSMQN